MDVMPFLLRSSSFLPQGGGMEHIMGFLTLRLPAGLVLGGPGQGVTLPSFLSAVSGRPPSLDSGSCPLLTLRWPNAGLHPTLSSPNVLHYPVFIPRLVLRSSY